MINGVNIVQLVDEHDNPIGTMEKMEAHLLPALHRAVSVLLFNKQGEWLLHQRAEEKYHCGGLWTNACCTHPYINEKYEDAARRRLFQEMGIYTSEPFTFIFDFIYKARLNDNLWEYEYDRVFTCITDIEPEPDPCEVKDWKYISANLLEDDIKNNPQQYTIWFKIILEKLIANYGNLQQVSHQVISKNIK